MSQSVSYLWREPRAAEGFTAGVSLHSHTNQSKETLDFIAELSTDFGVLQPLMRWAEERCAKTSGIRPDYAHSYWTPPLTPRLAILCYDGQVYTVPSLVGGRVIVNKTEDAESLNELQYLKAAANIYFASWVMAEYVRDRFEEARPRRIKEWVVTRFYLLVSDDGSQQTFKEVSQEETRVPNSRSIVHTAFRYPVPSTWLSHLKYRSPIKTFSNGTGTGHVRNEAWLQS